MGGVGQEIGMSLQLECPKVGGMSGGQDKKMQGLSNVQEGKDL